MDFGIIRNEPDEFYHHSGAWGHTALVSYLSSPIGFYYRHIKRLPEAQFPGNESTSIGSGVHAYRQSPRVYRSQFVQPPADLKLSIDGKLGTKEAKEWVASMRQKNKRIVTRDDDRIIRLVAFFLRQNPTARGLLHDSEAEVTVRWTDEETKLPVQIKADVLKEECYLADIKTTHKRPRDFFRAVDDYGYDVQAGLYTEGYRLATGLRLPFYFLVVQTCYPFETFVYEMPAAIVDHGLQKAKRALRGIEMRNWGEPQREPIEITPPEWWLRREGLDVTNGAVTPRFAEFR